MTDARTTPHPLAAAPSSPSASSSSRPGTVLVTGATGNVGGKLVERLAASGAALRVMSRRAEQVDAFRGRGVDAVQGSFEDRDSLERALDGCEQFFLLSPIGPDQLAQDLRAIDAAAAVGVRHVLRVSATDAQPHSRIPWARDHARADEHLRCSGLAWTRLQPGAFMSNLLTEAAAIRRGWLPQTSGHGATAWIDAADIADVAARVLQDPALQGGAGNEGRAYVLTGDRPLSYVEVAEELSAALGHRVRYVQVPAPLFEGVLRLSGVPAWHARGLVQQFVDVVRRGRDGGRRTTTAVPDLLGRPARTITDFAAAHRDQLARR